MTNELRCTHCGQRFERVGAATLGQCWCPDCAGAVSMALGKIPTRLTPQRVSVVVAKEVGALVAVPALADCLRWAAEAAGARALPVPVDEYLSMAGRYTQKAWSAISGDGPNVGITFHVAHGEGHPYPTIQVEIEVSVLSGKPTGRLW